MNKASVFLQDIKSNNKRAQLQSWKKSFVPGISYNVCQCSSLHELHHHPQLIVDKVAVVHVHNVGMVIIPHDDHLVITQKKAQVK